MDILVISAHADDETLGCGGTMLRHRRAGDVLHWLILTRPSGQRWTPEIIARKEAQVSHVAAAYGVDDVVQAEFGAGDLDQVPFGDLMTVIHGVVTRVSPRIVYVVHDGDVHTDHTLTARAAASVIKPFHMRNLGVHRVLAYETQSSTEAASMPSFSPTVYVDITETIDAKLAVMKSYETEHQQEPLPRSPSAIRALARYRGASVGVEYAEAFTLIRELL